MRRFCNIFLRITHYYDAWRGNNNKKKRFFFIFQFMIKRWCEDEVSKKKKRPDSHLHSFQEWFPPAFWRSLRGPLCRSKLSHCSVIRSNVSSILVALALQPSADGAHGLPLNGFNFDKVGKEVVGDATKAALNRHLEAKVLKWLKNVKMTPKCTFGAKCNFGAKWREFAFFRILSDFSLRDLHLGLL